jgi:hypothetical protein
VTGHATPASRHAPASRKPAGARQGAASKSSPHRWSQEVTETSNAMDLPRDVFKLTDPKKIARSLKRSAEHSDRRKSDPYRSAMSMLTFYVNRAGENLEPGQRKRLEDAKDELRALFGRPAARPRKAGTPVRREASPSSSKRASS